MSYTQGMKTAISIPDEMFAEAERFATRQGWSRSHLFGEAIAAYLRQHDDDAVTEAMNRVCDDVPEEPDPALQSAAVRVLEQTEW